MLLTTARLSESPACWSNSCQGKRGESILTIRLMLNSEQVTDRLTGNQANEHSEAILPREFQSSYSCAVELSIQYQRLCSQKRAVSEYNTLVARKGMTIFPNDPSQANLQSLHIGPLISEYNTLVARKGMTIFPNDPSQANLQSLHIGPLR